MDSPFSGNDEAARLAERLDERRARIAVIGLGYVGLPLALALVEAGFAVTGIDIDPDKPATLMAGRSYLSHISGDRIAAMAASGRFQATNHIREAGGCDVIVLCVPTPLGSHREPDLSYVEATAEGLIPHLRAGHLVVLESTTYPGTTRDLLIPILQRGGLRSGQDLFVAFAPEREDPGNLDFAASRIPKVIGGDGPLAVALADRLYRPIVAGIVPVSSPETAEAVKLTENIFRAVNIALVNELKIVFDAMGIDIWEVIEAAKTKPFGYMPFYPGPGLGGHCIPIDPFYLTWKAREYDIATRFIELAGEINTAMPGYVVDSLVGALNQRQGRALSDTAVLIVGVGYKPNVGDTRESPALRIAELLERRGAAVYLHDPHLTRLPGLRHYPQLSGRAVTPWASIPFDRLNAAVIVTDHDAIDYSGLAGAVPLIVDTRNAMRRRGIEGDHIVRA
jgi:UDP-N-acetyl-D-glucosamine dehydrogenase